jgi:plastocyanin
MLSRKSILFAVALVIVAFYASQNIAAAIGGANVSVVDDAFEPASVTIQAGDSVTWTLNEGFHNVRADDGSWGNTPGDDWPPFTHTFTTPGIYEYYCEIHSEPDDTDMNGVVIVEQAPTAVTLSDMSANSGAVWTFSMIAAGALMVVSMAAALRFKRG